MMRGTFGMKLRNFFLHAGLLLMAVLSLVLSYFIWANPVFIQRHAQQNTTNKAKKGDVTGAKSESMGDIYSPTSLTYNTGTKSFQLTSSDVDILNTTTKEMKNWSPVRLTRVSANKGDYAKLLQTKNAVLLNYAAPITTGVLGKTLKRGIRGDSSLKFNRIVVRLNRPNVILLLNDANNKIYRLTLLQHSVSRFEKMARDKHISRTQVKWRKFSHNYAFVYPEKVKAPNYSYLLNQETSGIFVTRLLRTNGSGSISTKDQKGKTVYYDGANQRMIVDNKQQQVSYTNYGTSDATTTDNELERARSSRRNVSFTTAMTGNLNLLNSLGLVLNDVRYDEYNSKTKQATYRSYINTLPIISAKMYGAYSLRQLANGGTQFDFSLYTFQVPLPAKRKNKTLKPTADVLNEMAAAGYPSKNISDIRLGYSWRQNSSSKMVIDMAPTYFVKYNGSWLDCGRIVSVDAAAGSQTAPVD